HPDLGGVPSDDAAEIDLEPPGQRDRHARAPDVEPLPEPLQPCVLGELLEPDVVDVRSHEIADPKWDTHAVHRARSRSPHSWHRRSVPGEPAVRDPVRAGRLRPEPLDLVGLVALEVALVPVPLALGDIALPREDVGTGAVEEPAVVR